MPISNKRLIENVICCSNIALLMQISCYCSQTTLTIRVLVEKDSGTTWNTFFFWLNSSVISHVKLMASLHVSEMNICVQQYCTIELRAHLVAKIILSTVLTQNARLDRRVQRVKVVAKRPILSLHLFFNTYMVRFKKIKRVKHVALYIEVVLFYTKK